MNRSEFHSYVPPIYKTSKIKNNLKYDLITTKSFPFDLPTIKERLDVNSVGILHFSIKLSRPIPFLILPKESITFRITIDDNTTFVEDFYYYDSTTQFVTKIDLILTPFVYFYSKEDLIYSINETLNRSSFKINTFPEIDIFLNYKGSSSFKYDKLKDDALFYDSNRGDTTRTQLKNDAKGEILTFNVLWTQAVKIEKLSLESSVFYYLGCDDFILSINQQQTPDTPALLQTPLLTVDENKTTNLIINRNTFDQPTGVNVLSPTDSSRFTSNTNFYENFVSIQLVSNSLPVISQEILTDKGFRNTTQSLESLFFNFETFPFHGTKNVFFNTTRPNVHTVIGTFPRLNFDLNLLITVPPSDDVEIIAIPFDKRHDKVNIKIANELFINTI